MHFPPSPTAPAAPDRRRPAARLRRAAAACLAGVGAAALLSAAPGAEAAAPAAPVPRTIPALQQWSGDPGAYAFGPGTRLLVHPGSAKDLTDEAQLFAQGLAQRTDVQVPVVKAAPATAQPGDITLALGPADSGLGSEGYTLTAGRTLTIKSPTQHGVFNATSTVLQLLGQRLTIPAGTARDWPAKPERGLMLDVGRKYFTVDWLKQQIDEMAYLKLNYLHLHLSDNNGFRVESEKHPEVVSAQHYTKAQITELIAYAGRRHITVVPEIDMPGHMVPVLDAHPELRLVSKDGVIQSSFIDLTKDATYTLLKDLIEEYAALFPDSPWFHIGADEYVHDYAAFPQLATYAKARYGASATGADTYYGFINWANGVVRATGKQTRMWNDGIHSGNGTITPASDILVENWSGAGITPQALTDRGHTVTNEPRSWTYYVLGRYKPPTTKLYETWHPDLFDNGGTVSNPSRNRGSKLHVWCDNPGAETEQQVAGGIVKPLRVMAQQLWGSPKLVASYADFQQVIGAVGHAPGWPGTPLHGDLALNRPVAVSSVEPVLTPNFTVTGTDHLSGFNAVDGEPSTRWSSTRSDPQWLRIDLGESQPVDRVRITWEGAYAKAYQVQVSDDASTWTTVRTVTNGKGGTEDLSGLQGSGRYVRLNLTQRATTYGYSLYEVEVYSDDLARGRPATASSLETPALPAADAVDGDAATRWSSAWTDNPQWISVDLGADRPVGRVRLVWEAAYAKAYQVQTSADGSKWTTVRTVSDGDGGTDELTSLGAHGRYLRILGTQRGTAWGYSLWSVSAYTS
ncbi:family 20 glycosylhydrolase [Streptomyces sp. NPDC057582]|uniref:family 20 glycosylhydrolase n=1 Tax=Streptomyces sp. NPDC057582 TaxID=3346174 RepID=UPI003695182B